MKDWHILFKVRHIIIITVSSVSSPQPASTLLEQSADTCSAPRTAPLCEPSRWRLFTASGPEEHGSELRKLGQLVQDIPQRKHRTETERGAGADLVQGSTRRTSAGLNNSWTRKVSRCLTTCTMRRCGSGRVNPATPVSLRHSGTSGHSGGSYGSDFQLVGVTVRS